MVPDPSRRTALAGLGVALAGSCTALVGRAGLGVADATDGSPDPALDWPMARYDAAGSGHSPDAAGPKDGVRVKWRRALDGFSGGTASPILVGDTLYATGGRLVALDAATGATRFVHRGSYRSSPARADARAYATDTLAVTAPTGVYGLNAGGGVRLLGREFGAERWHGPGHEPEYDIFGPPTAAAPVAVGRTVYAAVPDTARLVALDAGSGRERWRRSPGDELRRPAVHDGTLFSVNWPSRVSAYDADTGDELWLHDLDEATVLAPTATDGGVVVPRRSGVTALDADGSVRWRFEHGGNATEGAAAVADGLAFVQSGGGDGSLYALDLETGEEAWSAPVPSEGTPVVADGVVYAPNSDELVAFDAGSGDERWRFESRLPAATPAVGDGVLYVVAHDRIVALEEA